MVARHIGSAMAALALAGCGGGDKERAGERGGPVTVAVAPVEAASITRTIEAVADVAAAEGVVLTAERAGRVAAVLFREGERVPRGTVLVRLDAAQEQADVAVQRAAALELRGQLARRVPLAAEGALPQGQVDDLRRQLQAAEARIGSARALLQDTVIRAPFAGTVGLRELSPGALVSPGDEIATLDKLDSVQLRFTVPERELGRLRVGAPISARSPAFPDRVFEGRIASFDSRLDAAQRTLAVEASVPNPDRALRPGMLANVSIGAETVARALLVPALAVQVRGGTHFVYRIAGGCAERVEVEIGERRPDRIEVRRGLRPGDRVAIEGLQQLSGGEPVRIRGERPPPGQGKAGAGKAAGGEKADGEPPRCPGNRGRAQRAG